MRCVQWRYAEDGRAVQHHVLKLSEISPSQATAWRKPMEFSARTPDRGSESR
jgi:hypothetical protein